MKFEYLYRVVDLICEDMLCPCCHQSLEGERFDVCSLTEDDIEFWTECSQCEIDITIFAQMQRFAYVSQRPTPSTPPALTPESVEGIRKSLQNCKTTDIRNLLK